ncbi:MAG: DUF177 domain-containing protein [Bryobacteraceae bacterium]|nr:DUF177 domain-containing protein [Solibacteraceae bacterium]MCL4844285.1 DUF177 domain-containing protein [Bryobacteraceae bacterium]MCO5352490.1 DUF177 domain-containing protein [Bryobacteraceae bacterium]
MLFHLTELEHHPVHFDVNFAPGEIALGPDLTQKGSLHTAGTAELLPNTLGEIRLRGHVEASVEGVCSRCLEAASAQIASKFDLFYRPAPKKTAHAEIHLEEGEIDLSFYTGDGVELEEAIRDFVLLSLPMRLTCREECLGLCPQCGANRNTNPCSCSSTRVDERWAALRNL